MSDERHFCTVITESHIACARVVANSLVRHSKHPIQLHVFVVDQPEVHEIDEDAVLFYDMRRLGEDDLVKSLFDKYMASGQVDGFRWSVKGAFTAFLIKSLGLSKIIYLDSDIFFFSSFEFLFEKLDRTSIILTPHWRSLDPEGQFDNFSPLLTDGIFNAGFLGVSQAGVDFLTWWSRMCLFKCQKDLGAGYYDDQRYLDLVPIYFPDSEIIRHHGCNLAEWNMDAGLFSIGDSGVTSVNGTEPIVFIHFTGETQRRIALNRRSPLFKPFCLYRDELHSEDENLKSAAQAEQDYQEQAAFETWEAELEENTSFLKRLYWRLLSRFK